MSKNKKKQQRKVRIQLRKNQQTRTRQNDWTRSYDAETIDEDTPLDERVTGKGDLTRKRTIISEEPGEEGSAEEGVMLSVDASLCKPGRILSAHGLNCMVEDENRKVYQCATRRLLKSLTTDHRHVVVTGDRVLFRPVNDEEGIIERVEPRSGELSRASRGRRHVLVANVDQLLIVASAAEPDLKPHLIDRFLISAEQARIRPIICINKTDLVEPADLQPLVGIYSQLGYQVLLVSATTGFGIERLRSVFVGHETVVAGQSGVGKSSLLNTVETGLGLRVTHVSRESQKGRHTTTAATLYPLSFGGYVVDTPGIRQFGLWDVIPEEVGGYFRELRPFINRCRFPDCTHSHEEACGVKDAVADHFIDARRYESYLKIHAGDMI